MINSGENCNVFRNNKWTNDKTTKVLNEIMSTNVTHMDNLKEQNNLVFKDDIQKKKEKKYQRDKNFILFEPHYVDHKPFVNDIRSKKIDELKKLQKKEITNAAHHEDLAEDAGKHVIKLSLDGKKTLRKMKLNRLIHKNTVFLLRTSVLNKILLKKYCKM